MNILQDLKYKIVYIEEFKTVYIYPPVKTYHLPVIKKCLKYYDLDIQNIVVGRPYESLMQDSRCIY
jgi:hypothetical protein